ncbi:MAG: hypothetical protein HY321_05770 [Armatimonadetes bacterium]|nr:hypothetical protein [Armatimonadota bacterium]
MASGSWHSYPSYVSRAISDKRYEIRQARKDAKDAAVLAALLALCLVALHLWRRAGSFTRAVVVSLACPMLALIVWIFCVARDGKGDRRRAGQHVLGSRAGLVPWGAVLVSWHLLRVGDMAPRPPWVAPHLGAGRPYGRIHW